MQLEIRKATASDLEVIRDLAIKTFLETFASTNDRTDMAKYIEERMSEAKFADELSHPESQFFLAMEGPMPVGYLKVNTGTAQTDAVEGNGLEIERIYVLGSHHGKSVGQALFETAMKIARSNAVEFVWLGVWEANPRAIRFYQKNGFVAFGTHVFRLGDDEQIDVMMKRPL